MGGSGDEEEGIMSEMRDKLFLLKSFREEEVAGPMDQYLDEIKQHVNTRIDYEKSFTTHTPRVLSKEFKIQHGLGYVPHRFLLVGQNADGIVYRSKKAWTTTTSYFRSNVADMEIEILIW